MPGGSTSPPKAAKSPVRQNILRSVMSPATSTSRRSIASARTMGASLALVERMQRKTTLKEHTGCVNTVAFDDTGRLLVSGSDDRRLVVWDMERMKKVRVLNTRHRGNIFGGLFMPNTNGDVILSCAADGLVLAHYLQGNTEMVLHRHRGMAHRIDIDPSSGHIFYSVGEDGKLNMVDLRTNDVQCLGIAVTINNARNAEGLYTFPLTSVSVNPQQPHHIAVSGYVDHVMVIDRRRPTLGGVRIGNSGSSSSNMDSSDDDSSGAGAGVLLPLASFRDPHEGARDTHVSAVRFSPDGNELLASYSQHNAVVLFDVNGRSLPSQRPAAAAATAMRSHSDDDDDHDDNDDNDADEDEDGKDEDEGSDGYKESVIRRFTGHVNVMTVKQVQWYGCGEYVCSGSDDGCLYMWERATGKLVQVLNGDETVVNSIARHPHDQPILVCSGIDTDIKVFLPDAPQRTAPSSSMMAHLQARPDRMQQRMDMSSILLRLMGADDSDNWQMSDSDGDSDGDSS